MDIAKYIGLYLLKNNFCYIHGLGNMEIKKTPATHDGQTLSAPQYQVLLTPGGSIDDSLANFIATHEQTSISKAANALRDFSIATNTALNEGKEIAVPSLGKFVKEKGITRFVTDPHLQYTPPSIPILRTAKRVEEAPSFKMADMPESSYSRASGMNWSKIVLIAGIVAILGLIAFFAIRFLNNRQPAAVAVSEPITPDTTATLMPPVATDTTQTNATTNAPANPPAADGMTRVIVGTYPTRVAAERRLKTLSNNGNRVELIAKDSTNFFVVLPITLSPADSARTLDSLRRMFNPRGVSIYQ